MQDKRFYVPDFTPGLLWHRFILILLVWLFSWTMLTTESFAQEARPSGVSPQVLSLPSGPGSLEGLGESFEPDLSTGTASYPVSLVVPPGIGGFQPDLRLVYNGGNPNGPWGLSWKIDIPYIQRQTDKGLPTYTMTDTFIYSTAEKLIPIGNSLYRFKNESAFLQFRWLPKEQGWEAHTPDGSRLIFGVDPKARVQIPIAGQMQTFRWCLERQIDVNGNEIQYIYDSLGQDRYAYIREIHYNFTKDKRSNTIHFFYKPRLDIFSDWTSGGAITVSQLASKIEISALDNLVRRYALEYIQEHTAGSHSLLSSITLVGTNGQSSLPPMTFTYTQYDPRVYRVVTTRQAPGIFLGDSDAELTDMTFDGLPDLVYTPQYSSQRLYVNRGAGRWENQIQTAPRLQRLSSSLVKIADMDGNGQTDLLVQAEGKKQLMYYVPRLGHLWQSADLVSYKEWDSPYFDLQEAQVALVDVNNDKRIDIVQMKENNYYIWLAPEDNKWSPTANLIIKAVLPYLSTELEELRFADFTGDRLQDIVHLRQGNRKVYVSYFPHNGAGWIDTEIPIENSLALPEAVTTHDLLLGDINNDGLTDIILPGYAQVTYWLNQGQRRFTNPFIIPNNADTGAHFPKLDSSNTAVRLADMDGDGSLDLVYSQKNGNFEYIDFFAGEQPNLLKSIDNGLGRTIEIKYKSSTEDYIDDKDTNRGWTSTIPFPVQVVGQVAIHDANSGDSYITEYHYRNGYYDGEQKEFRGFAEVIETKIGDKLAPTIVTHDLFDVGDIVESRKGLLKAQTITEGEGDCLAPATGCYRQITNTLATYEVTSGVSFSTITRTQTLVYEATNAPAQLVQTFAYDKYGNQTENFNFGQVCPKQNGTFDITCGNDEILQYTQYAYNFADWLVNKPSVIRQTDSAGNIVNLTRLFYDGDPYIGLPSGVVTRGNLTRLEQSLGPLGNNRFIPTKRQAFDAYGNVVGIMDGNGHLTTVRYDDRTHTFPVLETIHLDLGRALTYTAAYDIGFGKVISATEFNGNTTRFTYDWFGRIVSIIRPGDTLELPTQQFVYHLGSPRSSITTQQREQSGTINVRTSVVYFDGLGRQLQTRSEAENGQVVVTNAMTFNARQNEHDQFLPYFASSFAYQAPDPALPHSSKEYDSLARIVRTMNADGSFASVEFQPLMQTQSDEEDNRSDSPHVNTPKILRYDGLERLIEVVETNQVSGTMESYHTHYRYDTLSNLIQITDAQGNTKTMQYDSLSRKVFMNDPDRGVMHYIYDDTGNLQQTTDAKGQVITYSYDAANRPLTESWQTSGITPTTVFTYHYDMDLAPVHSDARNTRGQVAYVEDPEGAVYFSYDTRGNVAGYIRSFSKERLSFVTRMRYDAMDRLNELTYPDGYTVTYRYNIQGLLEAIPGYVANVDYTPSGQRKAITDTNGVITRYDYDVRLRLKHLQTTSRQNVLQDLRYGFDQVSNIVTITDGRPERTPDNDQTQHFGYDSLYRLTQAIGTYGQIDYAYDSIGNMVRQGSTISDTRLNIDDMRYGEHGAGPHALTSAGSEAYWYDANGNQRGKGNTVYIWNPLDKLTSVSDGEVISNYTYDSSGQRTRQTFRHGDVVTTTFYPSQYAEVRGDKLTLYVFDDQKRVAQVTKQFEPTRLLSQFDVEESILNVPKGEIHWYLSDHLGSTSLIINETGQIISEVAYYPYGLIRYKYNERNLHYYFTDKELDTTGLYYYGARFYNPIVGRFLSVDPLYAEKSENRKQDPQTLNSLAYALNNPLRYIDPDGRDVLRAWNDWGKYVYKFYKEASQLKRINQALDILTGEVPPGYIPGGTIPHAKIIDSASKIREMLNENHLDFPYTGTMLGEIFAGRVVFTYAELKSMEKFYSQRVGALKQLQSNLKMSLTLAERVELLATKAGGIGGYLKDIATGGGATTSISNTAVDQLYAAETVQSLRLTIEEVEQTIQTSESMRIFATERLRRGEYKDQEH